MALRTKIIKVGQTVQTNGKEFIQRDFAILVLIKCLQDGVHDVISLLLVLNVVLCQGSGSVGWTGISQEGTSDLGLLLRVSVMYAIYCFNLLAIPNAVSASLVRRICR